MTTNTADLLVQVMLLKEEPAHALKNTLKVLSHIQVCTEELFTDLRQQGLIPAEIGFETVLPLLEKKDFYYHLPARISEYFQRIKPEFDPEQFKEILFQYYDRELQALLELMAEEEKEDSFKPEEQTADTQQTERYTVYYSQAFFLLLDHEPERLGSWIIPKTKELIREEKEWAFLEPLLNRADDHLDDEEYLSSPYGKLAQSVIVFWMGKIYLKNKQDKRARNNINIALESFEQLEEQVKKFSKEEREQWRKNAQDTFWEWKGEAHMEKGIQLCLRSEFYEALEHFRLAGEHFINFSNIAEIGKLWQRLGGYLYAEEQWLKLQQYMPDYPYLADSLLYYRGRYYDEVGCWDDALQERKEHLERETVKGDNTLWYAVSLLELAIIQIERAIREETGKKDKLLTAPVKLLQKSLRVIEQIEEDAFGFHCYLWLARCAIYMGRQEEAREHMDKGLKIALSQIQVKRKEYYDYYLTYTDLLQSEGNNKEQENILNGIYKGIQADLGRYNPLLLQVIARMKPFTDTPELLDRHVDQIKFLINPFIRTDKFVAVDIQDPATIIDEVRSKQLCFLPSKNKDIQLNRYVLPFFKAFHLLELRISTCKNDIVRYCLYKDKDNIAGLSRSNEGIYQTAQEHLDFSDPQSALLYIRFFFDAIDGKYGKFLLIEEELDPAFWNYDLSEDDLKKEQEALTARVKPCTFLFAEEKLIDEVKTIFWHFSGYILFKSSLFYNKIEVNTNTGEIRLYEEGIIAEDLPITIDLKATI